ncbi:MAG: putative rane protein [Acidobacteria bacterium]|nr:putative rane protein [Acidobacteriota bacterium]
MFLTFCTWIENSPFGWAIRDSKWLFPAIESVHLVALAIIAGTVLIVDISLLGWGLRRQDPSQVAADARPWMVGSLVVMLLSGFALFSSEATKCYGNPAFWFKMTFLATAILYTFTLRSAVVRPKARAWGPVWRKAAAIVSMTLWTGVGIGGRAIGFY